MINNFDDFCLYIYVIVDDIWTQIKQYYKHPGPEPQCSDSELITMALVGECKGWDIETRVSLIFRRINGFNLPFLQNI